MGRTGISFSGAYLEEKQIEAAFRGQGMAFCSPGDTEYTRAFGGVDPAQKGILSGVLFPVVHERGVEWRGPREVLTSLA